MVRHLAIGDIHGCVNELTTLVDFVALRDDDIIVTLGDISQCCDQCNYNGTIKFTGKLGG